MDIKMKRQQRYFEFLRGFTRFLATLIAVFVIIMIVGGLLNEFGSMTWEGFGVGAFGVLMVFSIIFAMIKEYIGGAIMVILGMLFAVFIYLTAGTNRVIAAIVISAGFWLPGILFIILRDRHRIKHI